MISRTDISPPSGRRRTWRLAPVQIVIFLLALTLHLALLLVPLHRNKGRPAVETGPVIEVALASPAARVIREPMAEHRASPKAIDGKAIPANQDEVKQAPDKAPVEVTAQPDAAALRRALPGQVAGFVRGGVPESNSSSLRRLHPSWNPSWSTPVLEDLETAFSPYFAPAEAVMLDQWQEPGGARRVVMRLPSGDSVCGRAEPWDPLNPLVEPVPMFHRCARRQ